MEKLREILNTVIVKEKYARMKFDINFDVIESEKGNLLGLYAPLVNLLCYTVVLNGIEVKSLFTCCGLKLVDEKRLMVLGNNEEEQQI